MDWTTPLKSQQADFIARLNQDSAMLLHCTTQGLHSELVIIAGEKLKQVRACCRKMVPKAEPTAPVREVLLKYLPDQLAIEAIATYLDNLFTKVDPAEPLENNSTANLVLKAESAPPDIKIGIQVKAASGSPDTVEWPITIQEINENAAIVCVLLPEEVNDSQQEYQVILAGFLPTPLIHIPEEQASLKLQDLLYSGGLRSYIESLNTTENTTKITSREWLRTLTCGSNYVYPVAIGSNGQTVATSSYDGTIKLWNLSNPEISQTLYGNSWSFYPLAAGSGSQSLVGGSTDKKLNEWLLSSGKLIRTLTGHNSGVSALAISPDSSFLVSGGYDGTINLWHLDPTRSNEVGSLKLTFNGHSGTVKPIAISPDGRILATSGIDKMLNIWEVETGRLIYSFSVTDPVVSITISPDAKLLASGSQDGELKIWHLDTGELKYKLAGHSGFVRSVAISDDGHLLASGSTEKTIKLWNLQTGKLIHTLTGHTDPVMTFTVKQDGQTLDMTLLRHNYPGWEDPI